jgi:hypothetical protein
MADPLSERQVKTWYPFQPVSTSASFYVRGFLLGCDALVAYRRSTEMAIPNEVSELQSVGGKFLQALANRDFEALQAC